jgi:hypothetical protein
MTAVPRMCNEKGCYGFRWIGQSFKFCDGCGEPYWDHTHNETWRDGRMFRRVISEEMAYSCYLRWEATA